MNTYIELYDYMYNGKQKVKKMNEKKIIKQRNELEFNNIFWIFYYLLNDNQEYILNNKNFKVKNDILYKFVERINNNEFKSIFMGNKIYKKNKIIEILSNHNDIDLMSSHLFKYRKYYFFCRIYSILLYKLSKL